MTSKSTKKGKLRVRTTTAAVLVVLTTTGASCTPGQIEGVFTQLATPFESGYNFDAADPGLLLSAGLVLNYLIPGLSLGPGL